MRERTPSDAASIIKSNKSRMAKLKSVSMELIASSMKRSVELKADLFAYFVDILEARLKAFYSSILYS